MQFLKEVRWWVESKSSLWHVCLILAMYLSFGALLGVMALVAGIDDGSTPCPAGSWECRRSAIVGLFLEDRDTKFPLLSAALSIGKPLLGIISTSILTISLLRESGRIVLSERACIYDRDALAKEQSTFRKPCMVFRMMNRGGLFLFDVHVSVALRFVGNDGSGNGRTYRFFPLAVMGQPGMEGNYPILQSNFPFRVYVALNQDVQSAIYVGNLVYAAGATGRNTLAADWKLKDRVSHLVHSGESRSSAIVVTVHGKDSISGKDVITSREYRLVDILPGRFAGIDLERFLGQGSRRRLESFNKVETVP